MGETERIRVCLSRYATNHPAIDHGRERNPNRAPHPWQTDYKQREADPGEGSASNVVSDREDA